MQFNPASADIKDIQAFFPLQGTYEIQVEVSDGPAEEDGKTGEHVITVEVIKPIDGDIDLNGTVNMIDLKLMGAQWLDDPSCVSLPYCADIDNNGKVDMDDYTLLAANWMTGTTNVVINEFLASNRNGIKDGDGETSDWIELYNQGTEAVSLSGWYLTDDADNLKKWPFPADTVLGGESYLVVFASNQSTNNYVDGSGYIHTNFSLDKGGEYLALVSPSGTPVSEYATEYPPQEPDYSYGIWYNVIRYFLTPTPGEANSDQFLGFTDKPNYSHERGFYDDPFELSISSDVPDATIRYTLDGSEPTRTVRHDLRRRHANPDHHNNDGSVSRDQIRLQAW